MNAAFVLLVASLPSPSTAAVEAIDLGKLTRFDAQRLDGRAVRVWFIVERLEDDCAGWASVVEVGGIPGLPRLVHLSRRVRSNSLLKGSRHTVEGVLVLQHEPAFEKNGEKFDEVWEVTVEEAIPVR
jgi:hypothetical protein